MSIENETITSTRILEHDIRNQLGNIYLAVEGIRSEAAENDNEEISSYTEIIISCCKQVENILKRVKLN